MSKDLIKSREITGTSVWKLYPKLIFPTVRYGIWSSDPSMEMYEDCEELSDQFSTHQ